MPDCALRCGSPAIDFLPPELARNRVLDSAQAAAFWGVSLPHWRRMYRLDQVPKPIKLSVRKLGWRVGDLVDALAARSA
ncbi:helix-turn-helix transcriptional regulator [Microvirga arabica]|uniref:Helix-turn-helix transcriptional regulator n=1 Tax=Microvirga arabica TaxID=1128671 RepID=A0ABV6Y2A4_9HYPH